ncbi:UDP-glycosyltransferase, partial [Trifolium medium]|nr:UDP-glycosyltransferase [Trifolium medium]
QEVQCEFRDLIEPVNIPGSTRVHGKDLLYLVQDRKDDAYKCILMASDRSWLMVS